MLRSFTAFTGCAALLTVAASAQLSSYSQDFEALDIMNPDALSTDGWVVFGNVFNPAGGFLYGYGTFPAPNGGAGFSALATGDGGPPQGAQYMNIFNDYNNGDHANGNVINALVFREQDVDAADVGATWRLRFDHRKTPLVVNGDGTATTAAFVKVLRRSDGSFATIFEDSFDSTAISTLAWATNGVEITIDPSYVGELLQFGFESTATNFDDTGRFYDNLVWSENTNPGIGEITCLGNPTSAGVDAELVVTGSNVAANNDVTLNVSNLPLNSVGYFITSPAAFTVYNPAGSEGHLCIAGAPIGRYAGNILNSGASGTVSLAVDLTDTPTPTGPTMVMAGDTQYYQYWSRDSVMGMAVSNFSGAQSVTFQ